ncbi:MAG: hypothetical protein A2622_07555 [Bdellovibrionales bacterium RIFCSPHIGHO2_01_FULL_40_29]|nr:MAG: hypothetical protein A2622_07555 [Bdellovibrionales bacterium RIFCSPHIGHO2_01_FULL_40_29]OFZ34222.1 MAG: hypothetical protein A3D17_04095 [Bdellovibrionales bacterium RIFCSPHIGHO2_02_FULL_40_15]
MKTQQPITIESIEGPEDIVKRLYELGLFPSLQIVVLHKISFNSVTVIQFNETILALNEEEMTCLRGS